LLFSLFGSRERKQLPDAQVDLLFYGRQSLLRQVDGRMPREAEAAQTPELVALLRAHDFPTDRLVCTPEIPFDQDFVCFAAGVDQSLVAR